jgi:tetratricopeptide (TPR) repeat protein
VRRNFDILTLKMNCIELTAQLIMAAVIRNSKSDFLSYGGNMKLVVNNTTKVGRNDPCHCGSGQKYKRCCLDKDRAAEYNPENFDPTGFKREMEQMMKQIGKISESKNMSVNDLKRMLVGKSMDEIADEYEEIASQYPADIAQDMIYDAMDMESGRERRAMAEEALKIYPNLSDAWIILAEEKAKSPEEGLEYLKKAVEVGEKHLGKKYFKENEGHFWLEIDSRPYMRAKAFLGQALWDLGYEIEAITHFKDSLRLNPSDNQGIRYLLMPCLLIKNDFEGIESLQKQFKDEGSAQFSYNQTLFYFKKYGAESKKALSQLKKSIEKNKFVPVYLVGKTKMPKQIPGSYGMGSKDEAVIYADEAIRAWHETPGAITWLSQNISSGEH